MKIALLIAAFVLGASSVAYAGFIAGGGGLTKTPASSSCSVGTLDFSQACNSAYTPIM